MQTIHCHFPLKVKLIGVPGEDDWARLEEALVRQYTRALRRSVRELSRTIPGAGWGQGGAPSRASGAGPDEYMVPSYDQGGEAVPVALEAHGATAAAEPSPSASDLIDASTRFLILHEDELAVALLKQAVAGRFALVQHTFDALGSTNRDDVALALLGHASNAELAAFARSPEGVGEAGLIARGLLWADRVALGIDVLNTVVQEHRSLLLRHGGQPVVEALDRIASYARYYGLARGAVGLVQLTVGLRRAYQAWRSGARAGLSGSEEAAISQVEKDTEGLLNELETHPEPATPTAQGEGPPRRPPTGRAEGGGGGGRPAPAPTLLQRQRAGAVRADAVHIEGLAASLRAEAARLERSAAAVRSARPDRAARLSASAAQKLREAGRLEADVAALRRQAAELERGAASATADFPTAEEADALFERARSGDLVRVPLAQAERQPGLLARLVRPLLRSRSGNRVVFRVEGGGSRRLISIGPGNNLTVARGAGIDLNFGSYERAVEFLTRHRGPGARIVAFEVDEAWVRSLRSVAIPEKGTGALAGQTRLVDVRFADDQLQLPARLIDELERFIIPGSGRVLEIGH